MLGPYGSMAAVVQRCNTSALSYNNPITLMAALLVLELLRLRWGALLELGWRLL
jgi:hypothetical protein